MNNKLINRRRWFDAQWRHIEYRCSFWRWLIYLLPMDIRSRSTCPCCGYPTLQRRIEYEICQICWWEDDGQDDADAEEKGGANDEISLNQARSNFSEYMISFNSDDERFKRIGKQTLEKREQLILLYEQIKKIVNDINIYKCPDNYSKVKKILKQIRNILKKGIS